MSITTTLIISCCFLSIRVVFIWEKEQLLESNKKQIKDTLKSQFSIVILFSTFK